MADPAAAAEAEARRVLAAAERQLQQGRELQQQIERGKTTSAEIESKIERSVARGRIKPEAIAKRAEGSAATPEEASQVEQSSRRVTAAKQSETRAQAALNRERQSGTKALLSEEDAIRRYGQAAGSTFYQRQQAAYQESIIRRYGPAAGQTYLDRQAAAAPGAPLSEEEAIRRYGQYAGSRYIANQAAAAAGGAGGGGVPPVAVAGAAGGGEPPGRQPGQISPETEAMYNRSTAAVARFNQTYSRNIQLEQSASLAMHRHGAFTTEFIQAAQRGETTIRELGFQTTATISKFGGWLGAGAAVYGVVGAVSALYHGALDAYSGVNLLQRVVQRGIDPASLRQSFGDLAGEFNLPISTVTDAVYQMGKVFHSQDSALLASRAVLYSVKVGELDVATATRYLISIVQGFRLPATQLTTVFDQINQAQNKFGITIADVEAGMAKASGQFRQSGGDVTHLIALLTTAQRVTGNTGQVIGTAISRAPNFLRQSSNQQVLESFGIKASTNVQQVIEDAFKVSQHIQGARLQELSAAIFGPQYGARVGTALLANPDLYHKVLKSVSPQNAAGSAQRELNTQLGGVNEQLTKVGVTLQRIGLEFAQAHFGDIFGGALKALNELLLGVNQLLTVFNGLPDPLKRVVAYLLEAKLVIAGLRRFQLGETIAGGAFATPNGFRGQAARFFGHVDPRLQTDQLGGPAAGQYGRLYRGGISREQVSLEQQQEGFRSQIAKSTAREGVAAQNFQRETTRLRALEADTAASEEDIALQGAKTNAAASRYQAILSQRAELEAESALVGDRLAVVNEQVAINRRRFTDRLPRLFGGTSRTERSIAEAQKAGTREVPQAQPGSFTTPTTVPPVRSGETAPRDVARSARAGTQSANAVAAASREAEVAAAGETVAMRGAAAAQEGMASRFSGLLGGLGDFVFAGALAYTGVQLLADHFNSISDALDATGTNQTLSAAIESARKSKTPSATDLAQANAVANAFGDQVGAQNIRTAINAANIVALQRSQAKAGNYIPFLNADQLKKRIDNLKNFTNDSNKFEAALSQVRQEIHTSAPLSSKDVEQIRGSLRGVVANVSSISSLPRRLQLLDPTALDQGLQAYVDTAQALTPGSKQNASLDRARLYFQEINRQLSGAKDTASLEQLAQERSKYIQGVATTVQNDITSGLAMAHTSAQANAVYTRALGLLRTQLLGNPKGDLAAAEAQRGSLEAQLAQAQSGSTVANIPYIGGALSSLGITDKSAIRAIQQKLKANKQNMDGLREYLREARQQYDQIKQQIQQQRLSDQQAVVQARAGLAGAETADPIAQATAQLQGLQAQLGFSQSHPNLYNSPAQRIAAVLGLRTQIAQAIQTRVQSEVSLYQSQVALQFAGDASNPNPTVAARDAVTAAQLYLQKLRSLPSNQIDPKSIIDAQTALVTAQAQLAQTVYDQATQLHDAILGTTQARLTAHGDTVAAARAAVTQAQYDLSRAQTPEARQTALNDLIAKRAAVEQAWFSQRLQNIQFSADIDRITVAQEIDELQRLLQNQRLTRDQRQQIIEQIHTLRSQDELDLSLGNIKLPTLYEIRRAIQGHGIDKSGPVVNQTNHVNISVKNGKDAATVGKKLDGIINGGTRNAMRSAGLTS